jgi:hypothetical protein
MALKDFIAQVKNGGLARGSHYAVEINPPRGMVGIGNMQKILMFCDQVQLPGLNLSTTPNRTFGEVREVPYDKLFDNINLSFYMDQGMDVKFFFDTWMGLIQNPYDRTFNYYNDYVSSMKIQVQDINDKTRYEVELFECYPKNISAVQLDYSSKDVLKLNVTMQYKNWTSKTMTVTGSTEKSLLDKYGKVGTFLIGAAGSYAVTKLPGLIGKLKR